jgi:transcriptional regulator PpsR
VAPFEYITFRRDHEFVAIGRDVRMVANLQSRLAAARQSIERDYWKMRDLESRYRSLYEASSDPLMLVESEQLTVIEANPAAIAALGSGPGDELNFCILDALESNERSLVAATLTRAAQSGSAPRILIRVGPQGEAYMLHARLLEQEKLLMVHLMPVAEAPVGSGSGRNETFSVNQIFDLSPDAIVVLDGQGHVLHANQSFLGLIEETALAPIIGSSLARWVGNAGGDLKMLLDSLRLCESARQVPMTVQGSLGGQLQVEISAVQRAEPHSGFIAMYLRDMSRREDTPDHVDVLLQFLNGMTSQLGRLPLKKVVSSAVGLVERFYIEAALEAAAGNRTAAAKMLGVSRQGFYDKLARYEIEENQEKS